MNAWHVYLVMQMDDIRDFFWVSSLVSAVVVAGAGMVTEGAALYDERTKRFRAWTKFWLPAAALLFSAAAFLPSTKTAAAMLILPAIVNNEAVKQEAGEMYQLAKQALVNAAGVQKQAPKK